jgi:hypothetical protein
MSYYPILDVPGVSGWTKLYNFSPNNWEARLQREQWINFTFSTGEKWVTETLGKLPFGAVRTVTADELRGRKKTNTISLLSLTHTPLPASSLSLPVLSSPKTTTPAWRATIGLCSDCAQTSYQGELDPFPRSGTLLTFGPFLQYGIGIENYLIFLNAENSAVTRTSELEIYDANGLNFKGRFTVRNNSSNMISLDHLELTGEDLPLIICRGMAGIPLYFSRTTDGAFMSLEHTHPPASFVVHGSRWEAQKLLKKHWFTKVGS